MLREEFEKVLQLLLELLQFSFGQVALDLDEKDALVRTIGAAQHVELLFRSIAPLPEGAAILIMAQTETPGEGTWPTRGGLGRL